MSSIRYIIVYLLLFTNLMMKCRPIKNEKNVHIDCSKNVSQFIGFIKREMEKNSDWHAYSRQKDPTTDAANNVAKAVSSAAEQADRERKQLLERVTEGLDNSPNSKEALKSMKRTQVTAGSKKNLIFESDAGFSKIGSFKPPSLRVTQTIKPTSDKEIAEPKGNPTIYNYPFGMGPLMMNGCFGTGYKPNDPCARVRIPAEACPNMLDAASFIGVGFDGRGTYGSQSRKISLIQRKCNGKNFFMDAQLPDIMNAFGIYDVNAETKAFSSGESYVDYLSSKSRVSSQKGMFEAEKNQFTATESGGGNLGAMFAVGGGAVGMLVGGPVGAVAGAMIGGAVGSTYKLKKGKGTGSGNSKQNQKSESTTLREAVNSQEQRSLNSYFSILFIDVSMYELTMDVVTPDSLTESVLQDFLNLPDSFFSTGAPGKYQEFLRRYGTHYIKSAQFGAQLKIIKTIKSEKKINMDKFSKAAEKEFKSLTSTLMGEVSQKEGGYSVVGMGKEEKERGETQNSLAEQSTNSESTTKEKGSEETSESEFTQTTVASQGGNPSIAKALFDFYSPSFKNLFSSWLQSIPDFVKPFLFQLKAINDILNMNMDSLFPFGQKDFGCLGTNPEFSKSLKYDKKTNTTYYMQPKNVYIKEDQKYAQKIICKYKSINNFQKMLSVKIESLARAISIYMSEGPTETDSFYLKAGKPGCEYETLSNLGIKKANQSQFLTYFQLKSEKFKVQFQMPFDIPGLIRKDETLHVVLKGQKWYSISPDTDYVDIRAGCRVPETRSLFNPVCIRGVLFSYDEAGSLVMEKEDYLINSKIIPDLNKIFIKYPVAKVLKVSVFESTNGMKQAAVPCNVYWSNTHTIDSFQKYTCVNFIAATAGDIFFVFSSIPKVYSSWYYVQITPDGVAIYKAMKQEYVRTGPGVGSLGDDNLYDSYFICFYHLPDNDLVIQYGKTPPSSDSGIVLASKHFNTGGIRQNLKFYSFGSGEKDISFLQVKVVQQRKERIQCDENWVLKNGVCFIDCHKECKDFGECDLPKDSSSCHECKHFLSINGSHRFCSKECLPGYSLSNDNVNECVLCTKGTYKSIYGSSPCLFCDFGYYSSYDGSILCLPCPMGKFSSKVGSISCDSCEAGQFTSILASINCTKCFTGHFTNSVGSWKCIPCEPGEYTNKIGSTECKVCKPGRFNKKIGSAFCIRCPEGSEQPHERSKICMPCDPGHFADKTGTAICRKCPAGTFQPQVGQKVCLKCPPESKSKMSGAVSCFNNCGPGTYSSGDKDECLECLPGSYQKGSGASYCHKCKQGFYQSLKGKTSCQITPAGTYTMNKGATGPTKCSVGTANKLSGATRKIACKPCLEGFYASEAGSNYCNKCPAGSFQSKKGQTLCDICPIGYFSKKHGSKKCKKCSAGSVAKFVGSRFCIQCEKGTIAVDGKRCLPCGRGKYVYKNKCYKCAKGSASNDPKRSYKCPQCPIGSYSDKLGAKECIPCSPGFVAISIYKPCKPCTAGTYQPKYGGSKCFNCGKGKVSKHAAAKCKPCPKGYFQPLYVGKICKPCPLGQYSARDGSIICEMCSPGTFTSKPLSWKCEQCKAGSYQSKPGQQSCLDCVTGTFSAKEGSTVCEKCIPGKYQDKKKQNKCHFCQPGTVAPNYKTSTCKPCPENYYQDKHGQKQCKKCFNSRKSIKGSAICDRCDPGSEIGEVFFSGTSGSNNPHDSRTDCAFKNTNCENNKKYWESTLDNKWPKMIFFKFFSPIVIFAFQIHTVKNKAPLQKTNFKFFGSNYPDCSNSRTADILYEPGSPGEVTEFDNKKPYLCYGFIIDKSEDTKTAALLFPIKFYRRLTIKDKSVCMPCKRGSYQPINGGFACLSCPPGTYTDKSKSTKCNKKCSKGSRTNSLIGADGCLKCPPGTYSDKDGLNTCYACEPGSRAKNEGSTSCEPCRKNWFMDLYGQKHCAACAVGCSSKAGAERCVSKYQTDQLTGCVDRFLNVKDSEPKGSRKKDEYNSKEVKLALWEYASYLPNFLRSDSPDTMTWENFKKLSREGGDIKKFQHGNLKHHHIFLIHSSG